MSLYEYSRWDGTQKFQPQSADQIFEKLTEFMMHYGEQVLRNLDQLDDDEADDILRLIQQEGLIELLGDAEKADGVRIFIGSENKLFSLSGSSVILSPYKDANDKVVGVLGVIGPTRLNYARIVPVVDYTAQAISAVMARKK